MTLISFVEGKVTVKQLVEALEKCDQDAEVWVWCCKGPEAFFAKLCDIESDSDRVILGGEE